MTQHLPSPRFVHPTPAPSPPSANCRRYRAWTAGTANPTFPGITFLPSLNHVLAFKLHSCLLFQSIFLAVPEIPNKNMAFVYSCIFRLTHLTRSIHSSGGDLLVCLNLQCNKKLLLLFENQFKNIDLKSRRPPSATTIERCPLHNAPTITMLFF